MSVIEIGFDDGSQDNIEIDVEQLMGNQKGTVTVPENFYKRRIKNVTIQASSNPEVSKTLQIIQDSATYEASQESVTLEPNAVSPIDINLLSSVSTVENLSVSLKDSSESSVSWASISELQYISEGTWKMSLSPTKNEGELRSCNIVITLNKGSINEDILTIPVTQKADYITQSSYEILGLNEEGNFAGQGLAFIKDTPIEETAIPASGSSTESPFRLQFTGTILANRTNVYASGKEVTEKVSYTSGELYLYTAVYTSDKGSNRVRRQLIETSVEDLKSGNVEVKVLSYQFTEVPEYTDAFIAVGIGYTQSEANENCSNAIENNLNFVANPVKIQENKVESFSPINRSIEYAGWAATQGGTPINTSDYPDGLDYMGYFFYDITNKGTVVYTSGASRVEGREVIPSLSNNLSFGVAAEIYLPAYALEDPVIISTDETTVGKESITRIAIKVNSLNEKDTKQSTYIRAGIGAKYGDPNALFEFEQIKTRQIINASSIRRTGGNVVLETKTGTAGTSSAGANFYINDSSVQTPNTQATADSTWPSLTATNLPFDMSNSNHKTALMSIFTNVLKSYGEYVTVNSIHPRVTQLNNVNWTLTQEEKSDLWRKLLVASSAIVSFALIEHD